MVELNVYVVAWVSLFDNEQMFAQVEATDELDAVAQVDTVAWCVDGAESLDDAQSQAMQGDIVLGVHMVYPV